MEINFTSLAEELRSGRRLAKVKGLFVTPVAGTLMIEKITLLNGWACIVLPS
jgi:hypothetical protein